MSNIDKLNINGIGYNIGNSSGFGLYTHTKVEKEHKFIGEGSYGSALLTANVSKDDTFSINGKPVKAYIGSVEAVKSMSGNQWIGIWIMFVVDGENMYISGSGTTSLNISVSAIDSQLSLPSKSSPGDFAVVTGTPIENVLLSLNTPNDGSVGDISILIGDLSNYSAIVGDNPLIELRPWLIRQYNGTEWEDKEAYFRTTDGWNTLNNIIFYNGELRSPWELYKDNNGYVSTSVGISGNSISMSAGKTNVSMGGAYARLTGSFTWTGIKKLFVLYDKSGQNRFVIWNSNKIIYESSTIGQNLKVELDMSKYPTSSNLMIGIYSSYDYHGGESGSAVIHKIWVE